MSNRQQRRHPQSPMQPSSSLKNSENSTSNGSQKSTPGSLPMQQATTHTTDIPPQITPMNPQAPLPAPTDDPQPPISGLEKHGKRAAKPAKQEEIDPLALSPAHERKAQQLAEFYGQIALGLMGFNPNAGKILYMQSLDRAREVMRVARHHKMMMKIVDNIISGNDYVACIGGHIVMAGAILATSNRLPENQMTMMLRMRAVATIQQFDMIAMQAAGANGTSTDHVGTDATSSPA